MRPYKVLVFIVCVMAILGALYWAFPDVKFLSQSSNTQIQDLDSLPEFSVLAMAEDTIASDTIEPETSKPVIPKIVVDSTTDSRIFLRSFYEALTEADSRKVRVLHYGDSQIEEDRMTMEIRAALQSLYGGSGVGLMPLAQTIPTLTVKQELHMAGRFVSPQQGPRRYLVFGPKSSQRADGMYGPMGQMAEMSDSLVSGSEEIMVVGRPITPGAQYDRWRVFADSSVHYSFAGDTVHLNGRGKVYGLSQESRTGVIVDNIPMRGCIGLVFNKMNQEQLSTFYRNENVRLIIMQFGGNAIPFNEKPSTVSAIVSGLSQQVRFLRSCAPEASILFIGPSDMMRQTEGEWETYPMVPYMDKLLRKMALEENIAYFSLYRWQGGAGSMVRWQEIGLAGADGVHFNRAGARKAGKAIAEWILNGVD